MRSSIDRCRKVLQLLPLGVTTTLYVVAVSHSHIWQADRRVQIGTVTSLLSVRKFTSMSNLRDSHSLSSVSPFSLLPDVNLVGISWSYLMIEVFYFCYSLGKRRCFHTENEGRTD